METRDYIESGILELYVYGLLPENENEQIAEMARSNQDVADEIVSIEKAIINLSTSFSPYLSHENFVKIRERLELRQTKTIVLKRRTNWAAYTGWAAAVLLLAGGAFL